MVLLQLRAIQQVLNSNFDTLANNNAHCTTKTVESYECSSRQDYEDRPWFSQKTTSLSMSYHFQMAFCNLKQICMLTDEKQRARREWVSKPREE